jgi:FkbM family methyltransferase
MPEIETHKSGLLYRPGTLDDLVIREAQGYVKQMPPQPDDVLLDLGANIGAASREPEPGNFSMLMRNVDSRYTGRSVLYNAAVVGDAYEGHTIPLLVSPGKNQGAHSTLVSERSRRDAIEVTAVKMRELLRDHSPTLLKIDIEGAEYQIADELCSLPDYVRAFTIEHHARGTKHVELAKRIEASGFGAVWESGSLGSSRTRLCVRVYERGAPAGVLSNEITHDSLSADKKTDVFEGARVTHKKYGLGVVTEVRMENAVVQFDDGARNVVSTRTLTIGDSE